MKSRLLALLISVMMLVTYMPAMAFAEDEVTDPEITGISYTTSHDYEFLEGENIITTEDGREAYYLPGPTVGDRFDVTYSDGSVKTYVFQDTDEYGEVFVNLDDSKDVVICGNHEHEYIIDNSPELWEPGMYSFTFRYEGFEAEIPVSIIAKSDDPEDPDDSISRISYKPAEQIVIEEGTSGYKSTFDVDGESVEGWRYTYNGPKTGDQVIINFNDETSKTYEYQYTEDDGDCFVNVENNEDKFYQYGDNGFDISESSEPWNIGEHAFTFSYKGHECEIPVTIIENSVSEISFAFAKPLNLVEGVNTYTDSDLIYDEETGESTEVTYERYRYPSVRYTEGNILTVDGTDYTCAYSDDLDEWVFINDDGDVIASDKVSDSSDQSYKNQWSKDNPGHITVTYNGREYVIDAVIHDNPVKEISFTCAEPIRLIEGLNTSTANEWDEENQTNVSYEQYECPYPFSEGSILTVNGTAYTYSCNDETDEVGYLSEAGDWIPRSDISYSDDQSYKNQWSKDNPGHVIITYMGHQALVDVEILENPVKEISFEYAKYPDGVELISEVQGAWRSYIKNDEEIKYFKYSVPKLYTQDNKLTVKGTDGSTNVYTYQYNEDLGWGFYDKDGNAIQREYLKISNNQSKKNFWTVDNPGKITVSYMGVSTDLNVKIVPNPVKTVEFEFAEPIKLISECDGDWDYEYDENGEKVEYFRYDTPYLYQNGNKLTVNGTVYTCKRGKFLDEEGNTIQKKYLKSSSNQSCDNQWSTSKPGALTVTYMGRSCTVDVEILENPTKSVGFEFAEPVELISEGIGSWEYSDGEDGEGEGTKYFYYDQPSLFGEGNKLTVNGVVYTYGNNGFYDEQGNKINNKYLRIRDDQSGKNPWSLTNPGHLTVSYMGVNSDPIDVKIVENPVESVSFEYAEPVKLISEIDGYWDEDYDENDTAIKYFYYDTPDIFDTGNKLTVNYKDGHSTEYICRFDSNTRDFRFSDDAGNMLLDEGISYSVPQSASNQWSTKNPGHITVSYLNVESAPVEIEIVDNPVDKISFQRADGSSEINLIENLGGEWCGEGSDKWYSYDPYFELGDKLTVTTTEGKDVVYVYKEVKTNEGNDERFVDESDPGNYLRDTWRYFSTSTNQYDFDKGWVKDKPSDAKYFFTITYMNKECNVPVNILENPVRSISFTRDGLDSSKPVDLMDGVDGWVNSDGGSEKYFFEYHLKYEPGDKLTVKEKTGESSYTAKYGEYGLVFEKDGDSSKWITPKTAYNWDDGYLLSQVSDQTFENQWKTGEDQTIRFSYMNTLSDGFKVRPVANPVESISFARKGQAEGSPVELIENEDGYYDTSDGSFFYELRFKEGDTLNIKYTGLSDPVAYTAASEDSKYATKFVAENIPGSAADIPAEIDVSAIESGGEWNMSVGEQSTFTISYNGRTCKVPVKIVASSIKGIDFARPSAGTGAIELAEGLDGDMVWTDDAHSYFHYRLSFRTGDQLMVSYPSLDSPVVYTYADGKFTTDSSLPEGAPTEIREGDIHQDSDQSPDKAWKKDEDHKITLRYLGQMVNVNVRISMNIEEIKDNAEKTMQTADANVDTANTSSESALSLADGLSENSTKAEIEAAAASAEKALADAQAALEAAQAALEAAQAYYNAAEAALGGSRVVSNINAAALLVNKLAATKAAGDEEDPAATFRDAQEKLAIAKLNNAEASNALARVKMAQAKIASVETKQAVAEAASVAADPNASEADKTNAAAAAKAAADREVAAANDAKTAAADAQKLVEVAKEDAANIGDDRAKDLEALETEAKENVEETTKAAEDAESHQSNLHILVKTAAKEATCTEAGNSEYWTCSDCGKFYGDAEASKEIEKDSWVIPAKGHDYAAAEYKWSEDGKTCKATATCKNDASHVVSEDGDVTSAVKTESTCGSMGTTTYTAAFRNELFKTQTKDVQDIAVKPHTLAKTEAAPATCTEAGNSEYWTCSVCGKFFSDAEGKTEIAKDSWVIEAAGHNYGSWEKFDADKHKRVCAADPSHEEYEAHTWNDGVVTTPATENAEGVKTYTCTVCGETKTEPVAKLEPSVAVGKNVTYNRSTYKIVSTTAKTVALVKARNIRNFNLPAVIDVNGASYKVVAVNAKAFTGANIQKVTISKNVKKLAKNAFRSSKATTIVVKSKLLTKNRVKGSLTGSKVKTVQVKVGSSAQNRKYVKNYKKIFTKANAGRKVTVK